MRAGTETRPSPPDELDDELDEELEELEELLEELDDELELLLEDELEELELLDELLLELGVVPLCPPHAPKTTTKLIGHASFIMLRSQIFICTNSNQARLA